MKFKEVKVQVTILTNFQKKGCWILNKSHLSSDENKPYYGMRKSKLFTKNKTKDEKFDKLIFGLEEELTIPGK